MLRLFLLRHAKSSWNDSGQKDIDRPLNERGMRDAPLMAARLKEHFPCIDHIVVSPSRRTLLTSEIFQTFLQWDDGAVTIEEKIYEASRSTLSEVVEHLPSGAQNVLMIGHNPGMSLLTEYYTGKMLDMPTCAIAEIGFELSSWNETGKMTGTLLSFDYPKKGL